MHMTVQDVNYAKNAGDNVNLIRNPTCLLLCIEHNYGQDRDMIYNLLKKNNYKRVYTFLSRFDDWYILEE